VEMLGFVETEQKTADKTIKRYHVVSELLKGVTLEQLLKGKITDQCGDEVEYARELLEQYKQDPLAFTVMITKKILSGLMAFHDKGYLHRDIDPNNIMITSDRKVKIIDFGVVTMYGKQTTDEKEQFAGKPAYASPEQINGDVKSQNPTTDIYSVGILMFRLITGHLPFTGTLVQIIDKQRTDPLPLDEIADKSIKRIIGKATEKKQKNRYQSAAAMRVALDDIQLFKPEPPTNGNGKKPVNGGKTDTGGKKKINKVLLLSALAAAILIALIVGITKATGKKPETTAEVTDTIKNKANADSPEMAKATAVEQKFAQAVALLNDGKAEGVQQLEQIVAEHKDSKQAANALSLLAALTYPVDSEVTSNAIKQMRASMAGQMERNTIKAHQYAVDAVKLDSTCYQGLFELATDYLAGEVRTGQQVTGDARNNELREARKLLNSGLKYAKEKNDSVYMKLFDIRINQLTDMLFPQESAQETPKKPQVKPAKQVKSGKKVSPPTRQNQQGHSKRRVV